MRACTLLNLFAGLLVATFAQVGGAEEAPDPDPTRFEKAVRTYEKQDEEGAPPTHPILFYGSSSIRLWKLDEAFPDAPVLNRGFGGSHISDCIHLFDRLVKPYAPRAVVFYAGDNDVAREKGAEQVFGDFASFLALLREHFPACHLYYVPIKPSLARWELWPVMKDVNDRVKRAAATDGGLTYVDTATPMLTDEGKPGDDLFLRDGLHLNEKGYALWNDVVRKKVLNVETESGG